jgi:hypothetical protein
LEEPEEFEGREVQVPPLDEAEKMLIAQDRLRMYAIECDDDKNVDELASLICGKDESFLPLMLVVCAHEAARFSRQDMQHRTVNTYLHTHLHTCVRTYIRTFSIA